MDSAVWMQSVTLQKGGEGGLPYHPRLWICVFLLVHTVYEDKTPVPCIQWWLHRMLPEKGDTPKQETRGRGHGTKVNKNIGRY